MAMLAMKDGFLHEEIVAKTCELMVRYGREVVLALLVTRNIERSCSAKRAREDRGLQQGQNARRTGALSRCASTCFDDQLGRLRKHGDALDPMHSALAEPLPRGRQAVGLAAQGPGEIRLSKKE